MNLPNLITSSRIALCPLILVLSLSQDAQVRLAAFVLFIAAALTDVWDGRLARKHGLVTDLGKLLDPIADKLLLACTFVPLYLISHRPGELDPLPVWGPMPLWVIVVVFAREVLVTLLRGYAVRKGVVIAAGRSGKYKTLVLSVFIGAALLWYPLVQSAVAGGWSGGPGWRAWSGFHTALIAVSLAAAVGLSLFSLGDYLWRHRSVLLPKQ